MHWVSWFLHEFKAVWKLEMGKIILKKFLFWGVYVAKWTQNELFSVWWRIEAWCKILFFTWGYSMNKAWNYLKQLGFFFQVGGITVWIFWAKTVLISRELRLCFSCYEFAELFIKKTSLIRIKTLVLQLISCVKVIRIFNSWLNEKPL